MSGSMLALQLTKEKGADGLYRIQSRTVPIPEPRQGQALVRIRCGALNHRDNWMTMGMYPRIKFDRTLGSDGSGTVQSVGPGVDKSWVGQNVIIDPSLHWGPDVAAPGPKFQILGMPADGTFAEYIAVPAEQLYRTPEWMTPAQAAALPLAGSTAWRALTTKGGCRRGSAVLVTGVGGGVALFALQFAAALGAEVTVTSGSAEKLQRAKDLGAAHTANYRQKGWAKELTAAVRKRSGGFDCIIDGAGGAAFDDLIKMLKPGGKLVTYGVTAGPPKRVTLPTLFLNNADIAGTAMAAPQDFRAMMECINRHRIVPVVDSERPVAEFQQQLERMRKGEQFGKLVVTFPAGGAKL
eukprot:TRINITY_DN47309_c0_g1_i1.p1 TRINITY_DN47309_c0_g1~~TRINITY_DN47309_c0_g1_i1.p1  ORF type:complete len:373 (+),score=131.22 TRINITY_DN47309_c0_g1_i1:66-1121(+)